MEPVKINSLELENVKRIRAVQIVPSKDGLTVIGGRNAQGKTSVLDGLAWALGGNRLKPENPNRDGGATPAKLHVELSNGIVVERKGKNGALYVRDTTGAKGTQKLLDEFLSQLALDLRKFMSGTDKDKANALLQTLGIDRELAMLDAEISSVFDQRRDAARIAKRDRAYADGLPHHDDAPDEPVSVGELSARLMEAHDKNRENQRKRSMVDEVKHDYDRTKSDQKELSDQLARLLEQVDQLQNELKAVEDKRSALGANLLMAKAEADKLEDIDTSEIEQSIADIETVNAKVRENEAWARAAEAANESTTEAENLSKKLDELRAKRTSLLDGAPLPLEGLAVDSEGRMTYKGQVWSDMSSAEQLRVATAIAQATKPECGFVLLDELEKFDSQQLAEFGAWATERGLQVIGTRVGTDDACTIIIEDGKVEGQDMADPVAPDPKGEALEWAPEKTWGGASF